MTSLNVKKGFCLNVAGRPSPKLETLAEPARVALRPSRIPFVKPRLKVKAGDVVKSGTLLWEDKRNPQVKFLSPGGGRVAAVDYGPRRAIDAVVIELDAEEAFVAFERLDPETLADLGRAELIRRMLDGGVWPFVRTLPFRDIADPKREPPVLYVALDSQEPFHPLPEVYLDGAVDTFVFGMEILGLLAPEVRVSAAGRNTRVRALLDGRITHTYSGDYPAGDPGTLNYHLRTSPADNPAWWINGQDVLHVARLFQSGRFPTERIVVIGGSGVTAGGHFRTRLGVPFGHLVEGRLGAARYRFVDGGMFTGAAAAADSYLGFYADALTVLPSGDQPEAFGFLRPGFNKPTYSKAFFSSLRAAELEVDCGQHGELRACINCGYCPRVCPVDILPQFTLKALLADEVEEALAHGLLDCVECGLCTFVCPSKIEVADTLQKAKRAYYLER